MMGRWLRGAGPFLMGLLALLVQLGVLRGELEHFFPVGSDLTLLVQSTPYVSTIHPLSWFVGGTAAGAAYPEWTPSGGVFYYPFRHLLFYVNYLLFHDSWGLHLLPGMLITAVGVALVFHLSSRLFQLPPLPAAVAATGYFLFAIADGFVLSPSDSVEPLAAVIGAFAFLTLLQEWFIPTFLLSLLALLCHASSLYAPPTLGAIYLYLAYSHRVQEQPMRPYVGRALALAVFPIFMWLMARFFGLAGWTGSVFWAGLFEGRAVGAQFSPFFWPLALPSAPVLEVLEQLLQKADVLRWDSVQVALTSALNLLLALVMGSMLLLYLVGRRHRSSTPQEIVVILWSVLSLLFLASHGLDRHFGHGTLLFAFPLLTFYATRSRPLSVRLVSVTWLLAGAIINLSQSYSVVKGEARELRFKRWRQAEDLVEVVKSVSVMRNNRSLYLANDQVGGAGAGDLARFATRDPASSLVILASGPLKTPTFTHHKDFLEVALETGSGALSFPGIDISRVSAMPLEEGGLQVVRNDVLSYAFPEGRLKDSILGTGRELTFGPKAIVTVRDPRGLIIYFDPSLGVHRVELPWTR